jgi:RNA polymerase sigma factor (sigma-70 family)
MALAELFEQAAEMVLLRHGWCLLEPQQLAQQARALAAPQARSDLASATRLCQQVYARQLYGAIQGNTTQEQAYRELHAYLYRIARRQRPTLAEDAAQEAILLVHEKVHTCHKPGAFLKFAIFQLLSAFHRLEPSARESSLEEMFAQTDEPAEVQVVADAPSLESVAEERNTAAHLLRWLREVIETHPRARDQILAVALKYLEDRPDEEIATMLGVTVAQVHILRSRGLKKLRALYSQTM